MGPDTSRTSIGAAAAASARGDGAAGETPAQLEALLASAPLGIAFVDRELRVERVSEALARQLGASPAACRGRPVAELLPRLARELVPALRRVLERGETLSELELTGEVPATPGRERQWLVACFPITQGGETRGAGLVMRDVTAQRLDLELERQRARHRRGLHELAEALVAATTPQDVVAAVVARAAQAFEAAGSVIACRTADDQHLELLGADGMPADVADEWRRFALTAPVPLSYVARTGEPLFLESEEDWLRHFPELAGLATDVGHRANAVVPLTVGDSTIGALGIAFDRPRTFDEEERALALNVARQCAVALERARLLVAEREARAAADVANQVKTQFLATISHELRTPLNAIAGYVELLTLGVHGPVNDAQRETLERVTRSSRYLLGLINNVLDLVRVDSKYVHYELQDVHLEPVLQFVAETTAPQRSAKRLRFEQPSCTGITARADLEKLRQILLNLLSNAIKFTDAGGTITVHCSADGGRVRVSVRDTGRGIAPDHIESVFDPFVQVHRLDQPMEGSGLGLAISRELARGMGGELTVESEPGRGSTFTLVLPRGA